MTETSETGLRSRVDVCRCATTATDALSINAVRAHATLDIKASVQDNRAG